MLKDLTASRAWKSLDVLGKRPRGRSNHTACTVGNGVLIFGGAAGKRVLKDFQFLDVGKCLLKSILL